MTIINRRMFLLASAAFPVGCALDRRSAVPSESREVRAPAVGQSWRYAKRDFFTHATLDTQVDQVAAVGRTINIDSHTEGSAARRPAQAPSWGMSWLHEFTDSSAKASADLPSEVQTPWGMVLVDPHWNQVQVFKAPIPLWPTELQPGWHTHINTKYKTSSGEGDGLPWEQTMKAEAWETVTVPAGKFKTLRYINLINFRSSDPGRDTSVRRETVWFAPEVGRWVARESSGSFYIDDSVVDQPYTENSYRWELLEWT
jgi:hypothetical protein